MVEGIGIVGQERTYPVQRAEGTDTVGRMAITGKADFNAKVRASMRQLQNDPDKIRSFYQKPSIIYAA